MSADVPVKLAQGQLDVIFADAVRHAPDECCGVLIGRPVEGEVEVREAHAVPNVWEGDRSNRFALDPHEHLRLQRESRERGLSVVGFYHSHPTGSTEPSAFDAELAWPDCLYLIVSLQDGKPGRAGAWRFAGGNDPGSFVPVALKVVPATGREPS
jgi:proteasome lid subunit RPN8/RPN11